MCGAGGDPDGIFSVPIARQRMPQIQRAPCRLVQHQAAAIRYIGIRGSQNVDSITAA